jgi:hypothetical protein
MCRDFFVFAVCARAQEVLSRAALFQDLSDKSSDLLACLAIPDDQASAGVRSLLSLKRTLGAAQARHAAAQRRLSAVAAAGNAGTASPAEVAGVCCRSRKNSRRRPASPSMSVCRWFVVRA